MTCRERFRSTGALVVATVGLLVAGTACDGLLSVENEQAISDEDLTSRQAVDPIVTGVAADYASAYADVILGMGLFGGELIHTGSFPSWREFEKGIGTRPSSEGNSLYNVISRAVWVADDANRRFSDIFEEPSQQPAVAEVLVWGGFGHLLLADNFCAATFNGSSPVPPEEVYRRAEQRFSEALEMARNAGATEWANRALAGRARTRLMLGDYSGAAADASDIPRGFEFMARYSSNSDREENDVADLTRTGLRREAGVHPRFYEDERYVADPRIEFINRGPDAHGPELNRQYVEQTKYKTRDSDIPVADWQEARLIEAEALLRGSGDIDGAVGLIDEVRSAGGLDPYDGPRTEQAVLDQIMYERSVELYLQAQHFNDLVRTDDPFLEGRDDCVQIGQTEWESNPNLGG